MKTLVKEELPLRWETPAAWAGQVLTEPLVLLDDHAHLEKKAALNALDMLARYPDPVPPRNWVEVTTAVARDEVEHLAVVTRLLARRGGHMTKYHRNPYASALRGLVRKGLGPGDVLDRLLVGALIEARSCERFFLLAEHAGDDELRRLYADLYASEAGHYRVFLQLAEHIVEPPQIQRRWSDLLDIEARIIAEQEPGPRMHGGLR